MEDYSAPKTGEMLHFRNENNGLTDVGRWCDYSWMPDDCKKEWPDSVKIDDGEWDSLHGNFPMTHWAHKD